MTTEKNINDFKEIKIFEAALKNTKEMGITIKELSEMISLNGLVY